MSKATPTTPRTIKRRGNERETGDIGGEGRDEGPRPPRARPNLSFGRSSTLRLSQSSARVSPLQRDRSVRSNHRDGTASVRSPTRSSKLRALSRHPTDPTDTIHAESDSFNDDEHEFEQKEEEQEDVDQVEGEGEREEEEEHENLNEDQKDDDEAVETHRDGVAEGATMRNYDFAEVTRVSAIVPALQELMAKRQMIESLLASNRHYQNELSNQLRRVDRARVQNQELTEQVDAIVKQHSRRRSRTGKQRWKPVPSLDSTHRPEPNADTIRREVLFRDVPALVRKELKRTEIKNLKAGIRMQHQKILLDRVYQESTTAEQVQAAMSQIGEMTNKELENITEGLDWQSISREFVPTRTPTECERYWRCFGPAVKKLKFSKQEDAKLILLANKYSALEWEKIAEELGTGRTPIACLRRYQQGLNPDLLRREWTEEEDNVLREAVAYYGQEWSEISNLLEGRASMQIAHRYRKSLLGSRRGYFALDEDILLMTGVKMYGAQWSDMSKIVSTRNDAQLRERYVNTLNPALRWGEWTDDENARFVEALEKHGVGAWSTISEAVGTRTDNQCWRYWKVRTSDEERDRYKNTQRKRKRLPTKYGSRRRHTITRVSIEDLQKSKDLDGNHS